MNRRKDFLHKRIKSTKELFGQIVHFIDGVKVSES